MQNQEFQLETFNQLEIDSGDPSVNDHMSLSIHDLDMLLDVVTEEFALIEKATGDIKWVSYPCRNIAHKLSLTKNVSEFPILKKIIEEACTAENNKVKAKWQTNDDQWQQCIGDSRKSTVSVLVQPNRTDHIWVRFYRSSNQDEHIRESFAAHDRLFTASRELSVRELVTTLSHELNQPLGALVNIVYGLKARLENSDVDLDQEIKDALDLATRQGQFASAILQRLRDFSHNRKPVIQACDIYEIVTDTLNLLDWLFVEQSVNVNLHVDQKSYSINADSTLLQQVLVNLLKNAVDAMRESETKNIAITVNRESEMTSISISDTGHGLKEGEEDTMFIPFNSKKTNGMGIGLNICHSFIELHQGRFRVVNNEFGGCTANILLPDNKSEI